MGQKNYIQSKICKNKTDSEYPIISEYSGFHINHIQRKTDSFSHGIKDKKINKGNLLKIKTILLCLTGE